MGYWRAIMQEDEEVIKQIKLKVIVFSIPMFIIVSLFNVIKYLIRKIYKQVKS